MIEEEKEEEQAGEEEVGEEEEQPSKGACGPPRPLKVIVMVVQLPDKKGRTVMEGIQHLYIKLKRQGFPIQRLHSNSKKEFLNHGLRRWCLVREVEKTTASADSPQENGRAEALCREPEEQDQKASQGGGAGSEVLAHGQG